MKPLTKGSYKAVKGEFYGTPKEIWGFRTRPSKRTPLKIAQDFLKANAKLLGLHPELKSLTRKGKPKVVRGQGSVHVIFQQSLADLRVHRAYVTVHLTNDGRVYLVKNRAMPYAMLPEPSEFELSEEEAVAKAKKVFARSKRRAKRHSTEDMWFPLEDELVPAWRVRLVRMAPQEEWIFYVDARNGKILSKVDNLSKSPSGVGRVFDPSPVTTLGCHHELITAKKRQRKPPAKAYQTVKLLGLAGNGRLDGTHVTTDATSKRAWRPSGRFLFESRSRGFEEVMAYYHIDSAVRYLKKLGFKGSRAVFRSPIRVNVHATRDDDSWYSPGDKLLAFGTGYIDDAEDGETILHELGHAVQDAICPDFGQSREAAAMGEGFGDYFAASFFAERKPKRYHASVMTWDGLLIGLDEKRDPPCLRELDLDLTYKDFIDKKDYQHLNGEIWSATLWDVRGLLGQQTADRIIVESHFQLDGFTTFARGARAILDADLNLNQGARQKELKRIFRARKIGPI